MGYEFSLSMEKGEGKMNGLDLYAKNLERKKMLIAKGDYSEIFIVKVLKRWKGFWFEKGKTYNVKKYPFKSTKEGTTTFCHCSECRKERKGKRQYDMYEVIGGEHHGSIIPIEACKIIGKVK